MFNLPIGELMHAGGLGQQQGVITDLVHQPRHAIGGAINTLQRTFGEHAAGFAAGRYDLCANIRRGLAAIERLEVASRRGALAERFEPGAGQMLFEQVTARQDQCARVAARPR